MGIPCDCENIKDRKTQKTGRPASAKPKTLAEWQKMIKKIYPVDSHREILNELFFEQENIHFYYRKFKKELGKSHFREVELGLIDYFVLLIRAYNSAGLDIGSEISKLFASGCWVCKKTPCECFYSE